MSDSSGVVAVRRSWDDRYPGPGWIKSLDKGTPRGRRGALCVICTAMPHRLLDESDQHLKFLDREGASEHRDQIRLAALADEFEVDRLHRLSPASIRKQAGSLKSVAGPVPRIVHRLQQELDDLPSVVADRLAYVTRKALRSPSRIPRIPNHEASTSYSADR